MAPWGSPPDAEYCWPKSIVSFLKGVLKEHRVHSDWPCLNQCRHIQSKHTPVKNWRPIARTPQRGQLVSGVGSEFARLGPLAQACCLPFAAGGAQYPLRGPVRSRDSVRTNSTGTAKAHAPLTGFAPSAANGFNARAMDTCADATHSPISARKVGKCKRWTQEETRKGDN